MPDYALNLGREHHCETGVGTRSVEFTALSMTGDVVEPIISTRFSLSPDDATAKYRTVGAIVQLATEVTQTQHADRAHSNPVALWANQLCMNAEHEGDQSTGPRTTQLERIFAFFLPQFDGNSHITVAGAHDTKKAVLYVGHATIAHQSWHRRVGTFDEKTFGLQYLFPPLTPEESAEAKVEEVSLLGIFNKMRLYAAIPVLGKDRLRPSNVRILEPADKICEPLICYNRSTSRNSFRV